MHLTNPSNFWFWYVTDMNDRPIEQGEGPGVPRSFNGQGPPHYLFHQYDPPTFKPAALAASVFVVPEICKAASVGSCLVEPTLFCSGR
jgi:hypothetical protein